MFGNNIAEKRLLKRKALMDALEEAKKENIEWKIKQLESKLYLFNSKYYPNIFWNSAEKGIYRKEVEA